MNDYISYKNKTKAEILEMLKEYGSADNLLDTQNDSPSVQEFLDLTDKYPTMTFHGYIITRARSDYRVSIEGFNADKLTANQALQLMQDFRYADDCNFNKDKDGTYSIYTWWD